MHIDMTDADSSSLFLANMDTPESSAPTADDSRKNSGMLEHKRFSYMNTDLEAASKPALSNSPPTAAIPTFPPPKTDKPRPHVCTTCMRSFARLEHLKRHERSHTKEKPFECPSCTRCFARRDLLLRHQQKLHSTTTPSSRPRNGRRESSNGVATGRVRKNSVASSTTTTNMRPRANTMSHIDSSSMGMLASGSFGRQFIPLHGHHNSFNGNETNLGFGFRNLGMSHSQMSALPRLDTIGLSSDMSSGLRTAPPYGGFGTEFDIRSPGFDQEGGDTINPHALHMHTSSFSMDGSWDQSQHMYSNIQSQQTMIEEDGFDWMTHGFESQMSFAHMHENAIDDSSPSAMSTNSPAHFQDLQNHTSTTFVEALPTSSAMWQQAVSLPQVVSSPMSMDVSALFVDMGPPTGETISPKSLLAQKGSILEHNFPTPPDAGTIDPTNIAALSNGGFTLPFKHDNVASTASTASFDSSLRQSSVTTASSELVNDHMRNVLMAGLNQQTGFGQRKQSQPTISSPLSTNGGTKSKGFNAATFPSTQELQRYVSGYIKFFHPHLPFLHIATLNFESIEYATASSIGGYARYTSPNATSGGSCLLLSVAAVGALLIREMTHSKDLFESAKRLIQTFLENRRQSQTNKAQFQPHQRTDREDTPLWLVQAMLLNVIYGHNCGDKTAADIASNHCAALVSLARGAELAKPYPTYLHVNGAHDNMHSSHMPNIQNNVTTPDGWNVLNLDTIDSDWYEWKIMEERKRTLYAVFILSSMLVTAYNRAPALTNSEIRLDLPCDEELWAADSAHNWRVLGGASVAETRSVQFASALTHLLTAAQRLRRAATQQMAGETWQNEESELRPSSFGCFVLINALHNYIWETRQRHLGRQWTIQEIDSMHAHIEPALRAWQSAWRTNPIHSVERPNPFGAGPLSADSIPLLDLAYVRLFVDFGRSKEAYWQRDYDAMAQELAKGSEMRTVSQPSPSMKDVQNTNGVKVTNPTTEVIDNLQEPVNAEGEDSVGSQASQRERHLRRAAFYAADHLLAADRLGLSLGDQTAQDLPLQSVLCACDSAQVLAEWMATVQERVGKYIGVLGRDDIDLMQIPSIMLLDDEDRKLINQIQELLANLETKRGNEGGLTEAREGGFGSRILVLISETMARAAVWPGMFTKFLDTWNDTNYCHIVTKLMASSLETQADHIKARAIASVPTP